MHPNSGEFGYEPPNSNEFGYKPPSSGKFGYSESRSSDWGEFGQRLRVEARLRGENRHK